MYDRLKKKLISGKWYCSYEYPYVEADREKPIREELPDQIEMAILLCEESILKTIWNVGYGNQEENLFLDDDKKFVFLLIVNKIACLLYTSPSPRD